MGIMEPKPDAPNDDDEVSVMLVVKGDALASEDVMKIINTWLGGEENTRNCKLFKLEKEDTSKNWQV